MTTDIGIAILALLLTLTTFLLSLFSIRLERLFDRYRLKYGFDKEIEFKEVDGKDEYSKENKVSRRERLWRRRVYKD